MRRMRSDCCACVASGQTAADPAIPLMRSRRRIACPEAQDYANTPDYIRDLPPAKWGSEAWLHGSKLELRMSAQSRDVRFVPKAEVAVGPALNGLDGRKAGTVEGYDYSEVNKNSEAVQGVP